MSELTEHKMNQRIKEEWVALLEHGDLKQCINDLHDTKEGSFCCLGVLCEIAVAEGVTLKDEAGQYGGKNNDGFRNEPQFRAQFLPSEVYKWAGLEDSNPSIYRPDGEPITPLAVLNDNGKTFPEIAKLIEENLE